MSPETKKQIIAAAIGLATGVLGTYAMVWRDVAVIKAELKHINQDIASIQRFIGDDDPKAWAKAKDEIRKELESGNHPEDH